MKLAALVTFYEQLTPEDVARLPEFYTEDAFFKDPFNEVGNVAAIQRIFRHMFTQVAEPRFVVSETMVEADRAMLVWEFHFRRGGSGKGRPELMRGVSHLRFAPDGRVCYHRDYWDTAEELYMKLPVIGSLMRGLRKVLAA